MNGVLDSSGLRARTMAEEKKDYPEMAGRVRWLKNIFSLREMNGYKHPNKKTRWRLFFSGDGEYFHSAEYEVFIKGNLLVVLAQSLDMQLDRNFHMGNCLFNGLSLRETTWKWGYFRPVSAFGIFMYQYRIFRHMLSHQTLKFLFGQTCLFYRRFQKADF